MLNGCNIDRLDDPPFGDRHRSDRDPYLLLFTIAWWIFSIAFPGPGLAHATSAWRRQRRVLCVSGLRQQSKDRWETLEALMSYPAVMTWFGEKRQAAKVGTV